jgi:hypothetical protein
VTVIIASDEYFVNILFIETAGRIHDFMVMGVNLIRVQYIRGALRH